MEVFSIGDLETKMLENEENPEMQKHEQSRTQVGGIPLHIKNNSFRVGVLVREREIEGGFGEEGAIAQEETQ